MNYLYLFLAIISEVIATSSLKATQGFTRLTPCIFVALGYGAAFYFLSLVLRAFPVSIAYAIWCGLGIVLIAVVDVAVYKLRPDLPALIGMVLILGGVVIINLYSRSIHP